MPKNQVLFEQGRPGTEFYIILDGEVGLYMRYGEVEKDVRMRKAYQCMKEAEIPADTNAVRKKSNFPGVVKMEKPLSTVVRQTASGVHVFDNGRMRLIPKMSC